MRNLVGRALLETQQHASAPLQETTASRSPAKPTFSQLLAMHGYIEDESSAKKERAREWRLGRRRQDSSDSD